MAWLEDFAESPEVVIEESKAVNFCTFVQLGGGGTSAFPKWQHTLTTTKLKRTCLTLSAAQAAVAFYNAQKDTSAVARRADPSGQYEVEAVVMVHTFEYKGEGTFTEYET